MPCTPDAIELSDNGEEVYFKKANCSLVKHWKDKYDAKAPTTPFAHFHAVHVPNFPLPRTPNRGILSL
jgi:hypothetical protein